MERSLRLLMLADVCMSIATMNSAQPRVLEGFPDLAHDDEVDACSGALEMLNPQMQGWAFYELLRRQVEADAERSKPQTVQSVPQPGSVEWSEAQKKKG